MQTDDITIPPSAVEAAARAVMLALIYEVEPDARANDLTPEEHAAIATAAIRAALAAWPGMQVRLNYFQPTEEIILPLTENPDAEA